ncbi:MAG: ABC transporter permease subunit [Anaerolineales bacterium]|nr:ABC transporter permease subunit [Anaerolineales bacterium]
MLNKLRLVWIVAQREMRDQFRDWRVLAPMIILTLAFPFLMDQFAKQTVNFLNQYDANLILDRLAPFSIMIIGFFPITVSLVVALESFVGEKERGTIEPLLTAPFDDWQLYFGKLFVGAATPLIASYLSIGLYLLLVRRQDLAMPSPFVMMQLLLLTGAHAVLMVSAAIVISVQSTSVKAANLLASFIVIPVAILMQSEAAMLFWGDDKMLWLAVVGVLVIAALLIRLGIAHFEREYLLGREIDSLNFKWMLKTFWQKFVGGANSVGAWYRLSVGAALRRVAPSVVIMLFVAAFSVWFSYDWVQTNLSRTLSRATPAQLEEVEETVNELSNFSSLGGKFSASYLFLNNTRAVAVISALGAVSFGVLGVLFYMLNVGLIGGVYAVWKLLNVSSLFVFFDGRFAARNF